MGMAASQARLLQLTSRKHTIGLQLTQLANDKVSLSRDMQRVSREYQNALTQKTFKWSNNSGVSYIDLSYSNLMRPSAMNQNRPYVLTDSSGKVIIDTAYRKYAEKISPNGAPGGDWESVRAEIIASLTGIDPNDLEKQLEYKKQVKQYENELNGVLNEKPSRLTETDEIEDFLDYAEPTYGDKKINELYSKEESIDLGSDAVGTLRNFISGVSNKLSQYLDEETAEELTDSCNGFLNQYTSYLQNNAYENGNEKCAIYRKDGKYKLNVKATLDTILSPLGSCTDSSGDKLITWNDIKNFSYETREYEIAEWENSKKSAEEKYQAALDASNQLFDSNQERLIDFYDAIFSTIAEKGWTHNVEVNDENYLNQMLQNNIYTITTVERDAKYNGTKKELTWNNEYETDIASNINNLFMVNDNEAREEAQIEYENKKRVIDAKETRIDTRMRTLETEQSSINQMLEGLNKVKDENIDRTMDITG